MTAQSYDIDGLMKAAEKKNKVRKPLRLLVFKAKYDVEVPSLADGFFDPDDRSKIKLDLKVWVPEGILTKDGISRTTKVNLEGTDGYNYIDPVREDLVSADRTLSYTKLEGLTRSALESKYGLDLSGLVPNPTGGIAFDEPTMPILPVCRLLAISLDYWMSDISKPIYQVDCYTSEKQNDLSPDEKKAGNAEETEVQYRIQTDDEVGTPVRHWVDGTGYDAKAHGFDAA